MTTFAAFFLALVGCLAIFLSAIDALFDGITPAILAFAGLACVLVAVAM